jgi:hypothetical protein
MSIPAADVQQGRRQRTETNQQAMLDGADQSAKRGQFSPVLPQNIFLSL